MKKVLLTVLAFAFVSGIAGFWTLKKFEKELPARLGEIVEAKTGRSLVVNGNIGLSVSKNPSVSISRVQLSNASWASEPLMASVDTLSVQVGLWPLFKGRIKIRRMLLNGVRINLETGADGRKNWVFKAQNEPAEQGTAAEKKAKKKPAFPFDLNDSDIKIQDVRLSWTNGEKKTDFAVDVNSLTMNADGADLKMVAQIALQKQDFDITAHSGLAATDKQPFSVKIKHPEMEFSANGFIGKEGKTEAALNAKIKTLTALNPFVGLGLPAVGDIALQAKVSVAPDKFTLRSFDFSAGRADALTVKAEGSLNINSDLAVSVSVNAPDMKKIDGLPDLPVSKMTLKSEIGSVAENHDLTVTVGDSDLKGKIKVDKAQNLKFLATFYSKKMDLSELSAVRRMRLKRLNEEAVVNIRNKKSARRDRVFSTDPLPIEKMKTADINLNAVINQLVATNKVDLGNVIVSAAMKDGYFKLNRLKIANYVTADAAVKVLPDAIDVSAGVDFNWMPLALAFSTQGVSGGTLSGEVKLHGRGLSEQAIASSLAGKVFLDVQNMTMKDTARLPSWLSFLKPKNDNGPLTVKCAVVNVPVEKGVLTSDNKIGLESSLAEAQLSGQIGLGSERMKLRLSVSPASDGILQTVFNEAFIGGTFLKPTFQVNAEQTVNKMMALGLAFFTGGKKAATEMMQQKTVQNACAAARVNLIKKSGK